MGINHVHLGSSHSQMFFKMVQKTCNFIKKRLQRSCFHLQFVKFLRTPFLQNTTGGSFCCQKDQKKQKEILRKDTMQKFLLKHNDTKKQK